MKRRRPRNARAALRAVAILAVAIAPQGCSREADPTPHPGETLHSILAVGDAGRSSRPARLVEGQIAVARGMAAEHARDPAETVVLLGDNFYWSGLTRENLVDRLQRNVALPYCPFIELDGPRSAEIASACSDPGGEAIRMFAVLGNHDLRSEESAMLQREVVPEFVTNWEMPGGLVETFQLDRGISLILFESELMLTQDLDLAELTEAVAASPGPWRIVAAHRPISMGERGAPALGGFPILVRNAIRAAGRPVHLYVSGHEHNMQLLMGEPGAPHLNVIAGSGARASTPLAAPLPTTRFAAQRMGFARIDLVRAADDASGERLVVSLFASPRFPILAWGAPELLARWSVGRAGEVRDELL